MRTVQLSMLLAFVLAIASPVTLNAQTSGAAETLDQYVSDLQKNPNDMALREKIIKLVQSMKKPPAIPEEARRHYVKAITLFKSATQPSDSADASEEFRQALLIAPWWGDAYMKMGLALEAAQRYDDAISSLKLFIATNPQGDVLRKTQDEIYTIEAMADKAAKDKESAAKKAVEDKQAQQVAAEARKAKEQEDFLRRINGARYVFLWPGPVEDLVFTLDVAGDTLSSGQIRTRSTDPADRGTIGIWQESAGTYKIEGRTLRFFMWNQPMPSTSGTISDDGNTITITTRTANGYESHQVYKRQR